MALVANTKSTALRSVSFRRDRESSWKRLALLCRRVEADGLAALTEEERLELPTLHRAALSALSVARAISLDRSLLEYLEALTARSHFCVYAPRRDLRAAFVEFFTSTFPSEVRRARWHVLLAAGMLAIGVLTGFSMIAHDIELYDGFVSPDMAQGRDPTASPEDLAEVLYGDASVVDGLTLFATYLFQHNTQVGILCFVLGFAFGVPVLYLMFWNGALLGAMGALYDRAGLSLDFWGWIVPHSVTELLAIILCGAAGLVQGQAVALPGRLRRIEALRRAGRRAVVIVLGSVPLFMIAALIEGYFRQLVTSVALRYSLALVTALCWLFYFGLCGTRRR